MKKIPIGISDFKQLINEDCYFVDKSLIIKELIDSGSKVTLITRPRRFGKTINMSMLKYFFEDTSFTDKNKKGNINLFEGLEILNRGDMYSDHAGK